MPLYCEKTSQSIVTQFDMIDVVDIGLVKFDFLGLRTLTIIDWALNDINRIRRTNNEDLIDKYLYPKIVLHLLQSIFQ